VPGNGAGKPSTCVELAYVGVGRTELIMLLESTTAMSAKSRRTQTVGGMLTEALGAEYRRDRFWTTCMRAACATCVGLGSLAVLQMLLMVATHGGISFRSPLIPTSALLFFGAHEFSNAHMRRKAHQADMLRRLADNPEALGVALSLLHGEQEPEVTAAALKAVGCYLASPMEVSLTFEQRRVLAQLLFTREPACSAQLVTAIAMVGDEESVKELGRFAAMVDNEAGLKEEAMAARDSLLHRLETEQQKGTLLRHGTGRDAVQDRTLLLRPTAEAEEAAQQAAIVP